MKQKIWNVKSPNIETSTRLAVRLGIPQLIAQLLVNRGVETEDSAREYLYPTLSNLHSPFLMHGMEKAVERIHSAIKRGEKIWVYGDYDADGTTAASLLLNIFRHFDVSADFHIPNRFDEGYGLNKTTLRKLREDGCSLLITVDCGITSIEEVDFANEIGIDVIITDHHQPRPDALPSAYAVICPKISESEYPFDGLAGVGLAFKLAHGLVGGNEVPPILQSQLDLVALGTVVDIATLTGENRVLAKLGLAELNKRERPGIRALCEVAKFSPDKPIVGRTLSYVLGPRINAAGRMNAAEKIVHLLTAESDEKALAIAKKLDDENLERRKAEDRIREQAIAKIKKDVNLDKVKGLVIAHREWHRGVIGIVASRILEQYYRPVFILAIDGDEAHGSGRSIDGINLADSLNACADLLVKHGGHTAAAGLTIKTENIPKFERRFNRYVCDHLSDEHLVQQLSVEFEIQMPLLSLETIEKLQLLEPFGADNPAPRIAMRNLALDRPPSLIGKENNHLKLWVTDGRQTAEAVGWNMSDYFISLKNQNVRLDLAFDPGISEWQNARSLQLTIADLQIVSLDAASQQHLYPTDEMESPVKIVNRRDTKSKGKYLSKLLSRGEPALLYVRDEQAIDQLLEMIHADGDFLITRCGADTPEHERRAIVDKLRHRELLAVVSSCTLGGVPHIAHLVFCHPVPQPLTFFNRCQPAFQKPETTYIHLLYNSDDMEWMRQRLSQQYPEREVLEGLYKRLRFLSRANGKGLSLEEIIADADAASIPKPAVVSGISILEELQLLTRDPGLFARGIQLLPPPSKKRNLHESETYLNGEQIKQTSLSFSDFQFRHNIQEIWKRIDYECRRAD